MKRALIPVLACALATSAFATELQTSSKVSQTTLECQLAEEQTANGTIMNVDLEKKSFTVVVEEQELVLSFDEKTQFLLDGKKVDAKRLLKIGNEVRVTRVGDRAKKVEIDTED